MERVIFPSLRGNVKAEVFLTRGWTLVWVVSGKICFLHYHLPFKHKKNHFQIVNLPQNWCNAHCSAPRHSMKPSRAGRVVFSVAGRRRLQQRDRRGLASLNRAGAYFIIGNLKRFFHPSHGSLIGRASGSWSDDWGFESRLDESFSK